MVSDQDVRGLLAERGIPCAEDAEGAVTLDSMSVAWLVHMLDVKFGISVDLEDATLHQFTSAAAIAAFANSADSVPADPRDG